MQIVKRVTMEVAASDGKLINEGDKCYIVAQNRCFVGAYAGVTKHGALSFKSILGEDITFNILPRSIQSIKIIKGIQE